MSETEPKREYSGHMTMTDGSHVPLTKEQASELWEASERSKAERVARLPDEASAIKALNEAYGRLKELGWNDIMYCPKDGTRFEVIENGSTGIFDCVYEGKWPNGSWMTFDESDCYPSSIAPALFRLYPEDEAKRKARMAQAAARFRAESEQP